MTHCATMLILSHTHTTYAQRVSGTSSKPFSLSLDGLPLSGLTAPFLHIPFVLSTDHMEVLERE